MYELGIGVVAAVLTMFVFFVGMCCGYVLYEARGKSDV